MFLGSSCNNIAENSTFARPLDFACRLSPSFHAFAEACATETLGTYPSKYKPISGNSSSWHDFRYIPICSCTVFLHFYRNNIQPYITNVQLRFLPLTIYLLFSKPYMDFPYEHWSRLRTNNGLERIMKEIRRRTRVIGSFPDGYSAMMLVGARLRHISRSFASRQSCNYCICHHCHHCF